MSFESDVAAIASRTLWFRARDLTDADAATRTFVTDYDGVVLSQDHTDVGIQPSVQVSTATVPPRSSKSVQLAPLGTGNVSSGLTVTMAGAQKGIADVGASSSFAELPPGAVFDGTANEWATNGTSSGHVWAKLKTATALTSYSVQGRQGAAAAQTPKDWKFQGSNDSTNGSDGTWVDLDTRTGQNPSSLTAYTFTNTTAYLWYRLNFTSVQSGTYGGLRHLVLPGLGTKTIHSGTSGEVWAVIKGSAGERSGWGRTGTGPTPFYPYSDGAVYYEFGSSSRPQFTPTTSVTAWHIVRYVKKSDGTMQAYINGTLQHSSNTGAAAWASALLLGKGDIAAAASRLYLAEVVHFSAELSSGDAAKVSDYLTDTHISAVAPSGVTGTVAGTSPAGVGSLTGTVPVPTVTGTAAGTSPAGVGSLTGTAPTTGTIAGTSPTGSGSLTGATSSTTTGTVAGTSPAGSGSLTGTVTPPPAPGVVYVSAPSPRNATVALGDGGVTFDMDLLTIAARSEREARVSLILTPAAVPVVINEWPIERQAHVMPALSAVQPRMRPHVDYSVEYGIVGRDHVFVDGQDVTFLRGCPTMIGETVESSPLGDDRASLEFPQVKPWDIPGEGDLWMLREDAPVEIVRITPEGDRVHRFDGFLSSFSDSSGDGREAYTIECEGVLAQAMHEPWEPPLFLDETDIGILIPRAMNAVPGRRWAKMRERITGFTSSDRGSQDQSVWQQVQNWLAPAWTPDGRQLGFVRLAGGVYDLQLKEPTTVVHWTVTKGAPGVSVDLVHDSNTRRDSVYGRGVAPDGGVWANWFFPFLDQFVPPPYPMAGFANMSVGTTDADTTNGRGVTQWQRRMRELGYNVRVDGVMNSSDTKWILRVQKDRGITVDGSLGPQTWNATFDPGPTEVDLRAVRRPLATKIEVEPYLYAANGARTGRNPAYDSRIIRHAMPGVNFGAGMRKRDAFGPAADILAREGTTGATGTITLSTDPHEAGASRLDIRAGHNVKVVGHRGETVVQVASVSHGLLSSTLTVDERARDALAVEAILERNREARKNVSNRRGSYTRDQLDKAEVVQYESESQAGTLPRYAVNGNSGLWSVVPIFVSQVGVAKIRLEASPNAEIVCALFSRPITPNRIKSFLSNPLASSEGWYDNVETLKAKHGLMEVFGTPDSPGGYWPKQKGDGPLTGVLRDSSSTLYDSGYGGVVWVALYTSRSTWVEGRIFPAVPQ